MIGLSHEWDKICCKLNPDREHEETTAICPKCHERHKIPHFTKIGICKSCAKKVIASRQAKKHIHSQS